VTILQAGFKKSGNFWLWTIIEECLKQAGVQPRSFIQQQPIYQLAKDWDLAFEGQAGIDMLSITAERVQLQILPVFFWPIEDLGEYIKKTTHVWTHSPMTTGALARFQAFPKVVCIIRDPRDVAVSYHRFANNKFHKWFFATKAPSIVAHQEWGVHVLSFLIAQSSLKPHIIFYERLLTEFDQELDRLLAYLELDLGSKKRKAVREATSFEAMQPNNSLHLAKGLAYGWVRELDAKQRAGFTDVHDTLLKLLEYPMTEAEAEAGKMPRVPTEAEVAAAVPNLWTIDRLAARILG
jgi:aryl sulfotransferase